MLYTSRQKNERNEKKSEWNLVFDISYQKSKNLGFEKQ